MNAFLAQFGVTAAEMATFKVSLFCYPHAPVSQLFSAWENSNTAVTCLVPEGVALDAMQAFLGVQAKAGATSTRGSLTVRILPFVSQPEYDRLLWACDMNFVRGEDSFVRAQWAGKPFVWHIYPQDNNLHHKKLRTFLQRYSNAIESLNAFSLLWNGACTAEQADWDSLWSQLQSDLPKVTQPSLDWRQEILGNGDLASNLLKFVDSLRSVPPENKYNARLI